MERARSQVDQILERFALRCAEAGVPSKLLEDVGLPLEQIAQEAQRYDLIVLGRQTHFHFATQESSDETLKQIVKVAPRPVVMVPEALGIGDAVLIAYDGSFQAARALQAFEATGLGRSREVHIVSVARDHADAVRRAGRAAEYLRFHEIEAKIHALASSASAADVLQDHARKFNAQLLVMGAYGQPVLRECFLGSVTRTMLKEAAVPLFLYH